MGLTMEGTRSPCQSAAGRFSTTFMLSAAKHLGPSSQTFRGVYTECNECAQGDKRGQQTRCHSGLDLKKNTNSTL